MPLYEYECLASAHHRFERIQKYSDPLPEACPVCGSAVRKLLSSPAIQFKGSGFYITDYAKKSSAEPGKGGAKAEGSKGDGGKSDGASGEGSKSEGASSDSGKSEGTKSNSAKADASGKSDSATPPASPPAKAESKKP